MQVLMQQLVRVLVQVAVRQMHVHAGLCLHLPRNCAFLLGRQVDEDWSGWGDWRLAARQAGWWGAGRGEQQMNQHSQS